MRQSSEFTHRASRIRLIALCRRLTTLNDGQRQLLH